MIDARRAAVRVALVAAAAAAAARSGGCSRGAARRRRSSSRASPCSRAGRARAADSRARSLVLRNLALACGDRRARAAARRRARGDVDERGHQHRHRVRHLELDARPGLPAAEPARGRARRGSSSSSRRASRDRIGIVAFSGEALTQVPLTTDYPVVQAALDNLQPGQLEDGTAIGTAIATAANRLRDAPGKSRVMILLTDGVNNRGSIDPRTAAKAAAQFGIKIYAIGVGTEGHGAGARRARPVRPALRDAAGGDRRRAAHRRRQRDGRPLLPRARSGRAAAHHRADRRARAHAGAQPHLRALRGAVPLAARR